MRSTLTETYEVPDGHWITVPGIEMDRCAACGQESQGLDLLKANLARIGAAKLAQGRVTP